jgi:SAM-dependent methyltransferase
MDRMEWLRQRRAQVRADYDAEASDYDDNPYPTTRHGEFVDRLAASCPAGGVILDAPCGTGQYFPRIQGAGRRVVGIDQSSGMLAQARAKGVAEELHELGLQEMAFDAEFDGAMTVDAMENVPPEDWPLVLHNLHRAVRPGGHVYLTVEEIADADIDEAFRENSERGLPAVRGEVIEGDVAGYHYYPGRDQVRDWLISEGLTVLDEATEPQDGWGYWHLLLGTPAR